MRKSKLKLIPTKILSVAVLASLTLTACQNAAVVSENANGSTASSTAGTGAKSVADDADPKKTLIDAMKNLQQAPSWIADVETSNDLAAEANAKMNIKYLAPDSFEMNNETGGQKMQIVAVGGGTYLQVNGKWQKAPDSVDMAGMINNWKEVFSEEKLNAFRNIQFAGRETVNGKELAAYTYEIDQQAAMPEEMKQDMTDEQKAQLAQVKSENTAKVWIDTAANLPARMEMTTKMTKPQTVTQKISVNYKYDEAVKIEAPKLK